ncbi:MAG: PQQ-binding-like beta-propeller repeat protein [Phycisphaerae bacterium]
MDARTSREHFRALFEPISGSYLRASSSYLAVRGKYRLNGKLGPGHMLRLAARDVKKLSVEAWHGTDGARIAVAGDDEMLGFQLTQRGGQTVARAASRDRRWGHFHRCPIDFRYQDGRLIAACGDVVLLTAPMARPPTELRLDTECRLLACHLVPCRPLELPPVATGTLLLDSDRPNGLTWSTDKLNGAELFRHPDGSLELTGKDLKSDSATTTHLTTAVGKEISLRLADMTSKTGFIARMQDNRKYFKHYVVRHRDVDVLTTSADDWKQRDSALEKGLVLGKEFWVRFRVGLDQIEMAMSIDGNSWSPIQENIQLASDAPVGDRIAFSLFLPKGGGPHRAKVTGIRIRACDAMRKLADGPLIARVPDSDEMRKAQTFEAIWQKLVAARPAKAAAWQWRIACDAAMLERSGYAAMRRAAARDLLETAADNEPDVDAVLRAAEELADQTFPGWDHSKAELLRDLYDRLAQSCFSGDRRAKLVGLLDSWLNRAMRTIRQRADNRSFLPPALVRLAMYDLLDRGQWDELAYQSTRALFLHRSMSGELPDYARSHDSPLRLIQWMAVEAGAPVVENSDDSRDVWGAMWGHPLVVQTDRETLNVISEFIASVNIKAYEHAARTLASQTLPDGIVPTGPDGRLYRAIHYHIRQLIRTHPELGDMLRERFAPLAGVRLQRALLAGDVETLQTLVVYFHGTEPARQALHRLADRELSMGNGASAATKYRTLLDDEADQARRHQLAAKYRLASALAGQLAGQPVKTAVDLPGKRIEPGEFEAMIASLVKARRSGTGETAVAAVTPPAPADGKPTFTELCRITADGDDQSRPFTRDVAWAVKGSHLIIHQRGRLTAVNRDDLRALWSHQESLKSSSSTSGGAAWPVISQDKLYARMDSRRESLLACIDLGNGKPLWTQRLDDGILSDPILINSWLYVMTRRSTRGGATEVYLHRVSPETGHSSLAAPLVGLRPYSRVLAPGHLALTGDSLLFRCSATLVCCDLLGQIRWIRRLTFVPPDVDPGLLSDVHPSAPVVDDQHIILTARTSPSLECIDIRTGSRIWSHLQPRLRRLVGLVGKTVVLVTAGHIEGMDSATGKLLWRVANTAHPGAIIPAERDSVLCVTLDRVDPRNRSKYGRDVRRVRWLSAADGSEVRSVAVTDAALSDKLYDVTALYTVGRDVIALASYDKDRRTAGVFRMRLR